MYRTQMKIIADVLITVRDFGANEGGIGVTILLRKANVPYSRLVRILKDLVSSGLLEQSIVERGSRYKISQKGLHFLDGYEKFSEFAQSFGLRT
ncbi:MAG: transcriptional regulator [Thaumarchaeota archaeon]|nr:transcriptional regulator [Nitrososphaerota archaeon]